MRKQGGPPRQRSQSVQSSLSMTQASERGGILSQLIIAGLLSILPEDHESGAQPNRANSVGMAWVGHTGATRKMRLGQRGGGIATNAFAAGLGGRRNRPKERQQHGLLAF